MLIINEKKIGAVIFLYGNESEVEKNLISKGHVKSACIRIKGEGAEDAIDELADMIQAKIKGEI